MPSSPSDARARLLAGPILPTFARLAWPTLALTAAQLVAIVIETYYIGTIGTEALAGVALVMPVIMLMQMMSAGAMGGGISSAVARSLGGGRREVAQSLAWHAVLIAIALGLAFTLAALAFGPLLYSKMGGREAVLGFALAYSNVYFAGAALACVMNGLASILRGTGDMRTPASVLVGAAVVSTLLTPLFMRGWGVVPAMGIQGAAAAIIVANLLAVAYLALRFVQGRAAVGIARHRLEGTRFVEILKVGVPACIHAVLINTTVAVVTAYVAHHGTVALAGYGIGARLEGMQVPIAFGLGAALVAMVGTNIGAGQVDRARRIALIGGACGAVLSGVIGMIVAFAPDLWSGLFTEDPAVRAVTARYFAIVGPAFGAIGFGMALYFSFQGTGRMQWPLASIAVRLAILVAGCAWVGTARGLEPLFGVVTFSLAAFAAMYAFAIMRKFGR